MESDMVVDPRHAVGTPHGDWSAQRGTRGTPAGVDRRRRGRCRRRIPGGNGSPRCIRGERRLLTASAAGRSPGSPVLIARLPARAMAFSGC